MSSMFLLCHLWRTTPKVSEGDSPPALPCALRPRPTWVPVSKGGEHVRENLVTPCHSYHALEPEEGQASGLDLSMLLFAGDNSNDSALLA